jgi:peptidoglycan/xylan/chitin deacetylase (PgdA/CDA1 family)
VIDGTWTFAWYDDEQPALLSWEEVRELDGGALSFEAHTVTHPNLLLLDDEASRREIAQSKLDLESQLGRPVEAFCYPAGLFGERERAFVEEAGYRVAVTCEPGVNVPGADLLTLHRRQIDPRDRRIDFRAKVGGGQDTPLPLRGLYRRVRYGEGSEPEPATTALSAGR